MMAELVATGSTNTPIDGLGIDGTLIVVGASAYSRVIDFARVREIADAVCFLASARASYVNGAVLSMDGGLTPLVA